MVLGLWGLVNNAGIFGSHIGPTLWMTLDDFKEVLAVNFYGVFNMTKTFLPLLKKERGSRIVNTSSIAGRLSVGKARPYCVSKHCVEAYSNLLR